MTIKEFADKIKEKLISIPSGKTEEEVLIKVETCMEVENYIDELVEKDEEEQWEKAYKKFTDETFLATLYYTGAEKESKEFWKKRDELFLRYSNGERSLELLKEMTELRLQKR